MSVASCSGDVGKPVMASKMRHNGLPSMLQLTYTPQLLLTLLASVYLLTKVLGVTQYGVLSLCHAGSSTTLPLTMVLTQEGPRWCHLHQPPSC